MSERKGKGKEGRNGGSTGECKCEIAREEEVGGRRQEKGGRNTEEKGEGREGGHTRVMSEERCSMSRSSADRSAKPGRTCLAWSLSRAATGYCVV